MLTAGGIFGTVVKVEEEEGVLVVEIAKDIRVRVARGTLSEVVTKPQGGKGPAQAKTEESAESGGKGLMSQLFGKK